MRIISLLMLVVMLASCTGPAKPNATPTIPGVVENPTPGGETGQAVISYATWDYERAIYEPLVERFQQDNPGIQVVLVPLDDLMSAPDPNVPENSTSMLRRVVSGADVAPAFGVTSESLNTPLLLNLKPYMDADATFDQDDFYPGALNRWQTPEGIWALPRTFYVQTLNYNKDLFQAAGLPEPKPGWSWDDLLAAAETIRQSGGSNVYGYLDQTGGMLPVIGRLQKQNVQLFGPESTNVLLTDPVFEQTLTEIRDLYTKGVMFNPYSGKEPITDPQQLLRDGRIGIWSDLGMVGPDGQPEKLPYTVGSIPYPTVKNAEGYYGGGADGYIISGGTASPEAAWKWVEFLTRQPVTQPGSPGYYPGQVPARKSLADALKFWENQSEESAAALRWSIENMPPFSSQNYDYTLISGLGQAVGIIITDSNAKINQALIDAQKFVDDSRAQVGLTPTPLPDTSPVLVATPEPQTAPEGAIAITYSTYGSNPTELRRLIRTFREDHPEIYINLKNTESYTSMVQLADVAQQVDCFGWPGAGLQAKDYEQLLDIRPLLDADATFPRDDLPIALQSAFEYNGGLYGLPYAFNVRNLVYNKTLFEELGVPLPGKTPMTPDEFVQTAQALASGEGEQQKFGYVPLGGPQNDMIFFASLQGNHLATGTWPNTQPNFNTPENIKTIQWFIDLATVQKIMPALEIGYSPNVPVNDRSYEYVQAGRVGMWFDFGRGSFGSTPMPIKPGIGEPVDPIPSQSPFEAGIAPLPLGDKGLGRSDMYTRGFHISKQAENPQACWEFIKFLTTDLTQIYSDIPARRSVAQSEAYKALAMQERLEVLDMYSEVLDRPMRDNDDPNALWNLDLYWFSKAIMTAAQGKGDLATELDTAQKFTSAYAECIARGKPDQVLPAKCALEADPEYDGYNTDNPGIPKG